MKNSCLFLCAWVLFACNNNTPPVSVDVYTTTSDKSQTMNYSEVSLSKMKDGDNTDNIIVLDPEVKYQEMDGFGAAITGSSCYNLLQMKPEDRTALLKETFDPEEGYGYSYIRISIGCSDFSLEDYTYCDIPGIENFAIHELDKRDLFPILKEILAINPDVKIMASPWTCPKWMKVNNLKDLKPYDSWTSGQLNPSFYQDYATYFVKYLQAMKDAGFNIDAITIQNEPLNRGNSASLYMTWQEQRDFIKQALGPAFENAGIKTKVLVYDHNYNYDDEKPENFDQGQYPLKIYEDEEAAKYVHGAAYHAYGGDKSEMLRVHEARPDKELYFTEISIGLWGNGYDFGDDLMWNMREVSIGTINNYCKGVLVWNYMLDDKHGPDRPGGCDICLGAIDIDSKDYKTMTKNSHYYEMAHLSKVIKRGAYRIKSEGKTREGLHYTAFENPNGSYSMLIQNDTDEPVDVTVRMGEKGFVHQLEPKSVSSYYWKE
ncbi:MAG: glucosylceramidase [Candidatus Azobacteroides sp.]|nr:glucosylceramidase [Candidatus Azobacteroides sp.]